MRPEILWEHKGGKGLVSKPQIGLSSSSLCFSQLLSPLSCSFRAPRLLETLASETGNSREACLLLLLYFGVACLLSWATHVLQGPGGLSSQVDRPADPAEVRTIMCPWLLIDSEPVKSR